MEYQNGGNLRLSQLTECELGSCLVLGGDGRFFNLKAALVILRMMAANGVARVITAPVVSLLTLSLYVS